MAWDKLPATSAERLQKLQNRAARVITKQGIRRSLDWYSLAERRLKHKATRNTIFAGTREAWLKFF